jgi:hypothetical protein
MLVVMVVQYVAALELVVDNYDDNVYEWIWDRIHVSNFGSSHNGRY